MGAYCLVATSLGITAGAVVSSTAPSPTSLVAVVIVGVGWWIILILGWGRGGGRYGGCMPSREEGVGAPYGIMVKGFAYIASEGLAGFACSSKAYIAFAAEYR